MAETTKVTNEVHDFKSGLFKHSYNAKKRIFNVQGDINSELLATFNQFLLDVFNCPVHEIADHLDYRKVNGKFVSTIPELTVNITSHGGYCSQGFYLYDILKGLPKEIELTTIINGYCMSAATFPFCAGKNRLVLPNSKFMMHQAKAGLGYAHESVWESWLEDLKASNRQILSVYAKTTGKNVKEIAKDFWRTDYVLSGQAIVNYGLATKLI